MLSYGRRDASPNASHNVSTQQRKYRREISYKKIDNAGLLHWALQKIYGSRESWIC